MINYGLDKEVVLHNHNGILYNCKKEYYYTIHHDMVEVKLC